MDCILRRYLILTILIAHWALTHRYFKVWDWPKQEFNTQGAQEKGTRRAQGAHV